LLGHRAYFLQELKADGKSYWLFVEGTRVVFRYADNNVIPAALYSLSI